MLKGRSSTLPRRLKHLLCFRKKKLKVKKMADLPPFDDPVAQAQAQAQAQTDAAAAAAAGAGAAGAALELLELELPSYKP